MKGPLKKFGWSEVRYIRVRYNRGWLYFFRRSFRREMHLRTHFDLVNKIVWMLELPLLFFSKRQLFLRLREITTTSSNYILKQNSLYAFLSQCGKTADSMVLNMYKLCGHRGTLFANCHGGFPFGYIWLFLHISLFSDTFLLNFNKFIFFNPIH